MIRTIVRIDRDACNGCGLCVTACHEGAIGLVDGKAQLLRDDYCDGMGDCLPVCPCGAISFEERDAAAYDVAAVATRPPVPPANAPARVAPVPAGAGELVGELVGECAARGAVAAGVPVLAASFGVERPMGVAAPVFGAGPGAATAPTSQLAQWPCQIKLAPARAPYFDGADLLVAADCTAFACADFHERFMAGRVTLVGCPKLDAVDYAEKLGAILASNDVRSVLLARMDVPCCGGLQNALVRAIAASGKAIPLDTVTLGRDGRVLG